MDFFCPTKVEGFASIFSKLQFKKRFFSRIKTNVVSSFSTRKSPDEGSIALDFKKL